ncbi:MAG: hypothetical protein LUF33_01260 [Clostridiales bacterium]|nr:hypothetical protein [Clostridiales bacterium]
MNGESESTVILFPDFQKLKEEVEKLKTELSMLMLERDELVFTVCKNIQTQYMLEMGGLEYKAYKAQCAALRLKRKIEMIQSKKNRQEMINISVIEQVLDTEFSEYQHKLDEQVNQINKAIERKNAKKLSEEEARELKNHTER